MNRAKKGWPWYIILRYNFSVLMFTGKNTEKQTAFMVVKLAVNCSRVSLELELLLFSSVMLSASVIVRL